MSGNIRDETSGVGGERLPASDRYAALETATTFVVYDRENHRAWLESDLALAVETMR